MPTVPKKPAEALPGETTRLLQPVVTAFTAVTHGTAGTASSGGAVSLLLCLFLVIGNVLIHARQLCAEELSFGIVPQQAAQKLARGWGPVCKALAQLSGIDIHFATAPDIPEFERRLLAGEYDVAYMNPYHYTVFSVKPGYRAIAKERDKKIVGLVVVRKDSPYHRLEDLADTTLVFPSPAAFAASILTRAHFQKAQIPISPRYVKSHDSVYRNVALGFAAGGGGVERTLCNSSRQIQEQLRVLWLSRPYTPHAVAVHPRLSGKVRERLLDALLKMNDDAALRPLLGTLALTGFAPATDSDWDDVRGLDINVLTSLLMK